MSDDADPIDRLRNGLRLVSGVVEQFAASTASLDALLQSIVRSIATALPDTCNLLFVDAERMLTPVAFYDSDPDVIARFGTVMQRKHTPSEAPVAAAALLEGDVFVPQIDYDALDRRLPAEAAARLRAVNARGMIGVPMAVRGELLGALVLLRRRPEHPPLDELDLELMKAIANHAALAIHNARLFARLEHSEALRTAENRAVEASRLLDAIVENIPDMVFVKDADQLAFARFNRAGEQLLGMSRDQLLGKNDYDFFPKSEADFFVAKDRETLAAKAMVEIPEEPIQTRTGQRWLHTKKVPLLDRDGTARYLLGISRDITASKQALQDLRAAKETAERANHELEAFSYSVAHDLRAPLRAIDGFSLALIEDHADKLDDSGKRALHRVRSAAQRMAMLIDDLLALSRVTRADLQCERVELSAVAREIVDELRRGEPSREIEIVIASDLYAYVDRRLVAVAFTNLFDNAWKFTSKSPHARIELGAMHQGGERVFFIRDNGAGFDMAFVGKLFGVFHRLHAEADYPGTGIGLATVARIMERHRGRVWAEGETGRGATFYFTL
jgi:PAS domain S-box-containing protein